MNFFGHAFVACWTRRDAGFVLGAMLPDFASLSRARLVGSADDAVRAGIALHHETDAAFHGARVFVELCARTTAELEADGLSRGAARAAAHVGVELLLDGELVAEAGVRAAYVDAIDRAADAQIDWHDAEHAERYRALARRLPHYGVPDGYAEPRVVAARIAGSLAHRPRLALRDDQHEVLTARLAALQPDVREQRRELLAEVRAQLGKPRIDAM